ncbi:MAG: glycoside hydrolase family 88 protein [Marinagarivorans sp.]|nr:glycoside hydrolase family 88 protein [Marinagarivorans sp.]
MNRLIKLPKTLLVAAPLLVLLGCSGTDTGSSSSVVATLTSASLAHSSLASVSSSSSVSSVSPVSSFNSSASSSAGEPLTSAQSVALKMAESIMTRNPNSYGGWNYETGTVLRGFEELYKVTQDVRLFNYVKSTVDSVVSASGAINGFKESDYNIDEVKQGTSLLYLYSVTGEERYKQAADALRNQLANHPRTHDGGFWHKNKYPWQMWLDGLYMGQPFYVQYSLMFAETSNFDDVYKQLTLMEKHSLDPKTGLLYHAWDESGDSSWANATTHQSPVFWGRSIGWYVMALVDVLDYFPVERTEQRQVLIDVLQHQIAALAPFQDEDGVWWQVTDRVGDSANWQESSATAMYVYAVAKGMRKGYLGQEHTAMLNKGWAGLNRLFVVQNTNDLLTLTQTCEGTGVGSSYSFYVGRRAVDNDHKGLGPYLLAGAEMILRGVYQ